MKQKIKEPKPERNSKTNKQEENKIINQIIAMINNEEEK